MKHIAGVVSRAVGHATQITSPESSSSLEINSAINTSGPASGPGLESEHGGLTSHERLTAEGAGFDRPRERLQHLGASALSDAELLALLLRTGDRSGDALAVARTLLTESDGLVGLRRISEGDLIGVPGLGPAKIGSIRAAVELGRRLSGRRLRRGDAIRGPGDIHQHFHPRLRDLANEYFVAVLLDSRHRVLKEVVVSQGTLTASLVHPREVFRRAVREAAAAIVLVHNHPSGDPSPSSEDRQVTERLGQAGLILGIRIIDHVVVAEEGYFSFSESGELPEFASA